MPRKTRVGTTATNVTGRRTRVGTVSTVVQKRWARVAGVAVLIADWVAFVAASRPGGALGNNGITVTSATVAVTIPGTAQVGDVALVTISTYNGTVTMTTAPTGLTLRSGPDRQGSDGTSWIYTRTLQAGDLGATWTWTLSNDYQPVAVLDIYREVTETGIVVAAPVLNTSTTTTATLPTTTAPTNALVHAAFCRRVTSTTPVDVPFPAGYTAGARSASAGASPTVSVETGHKVPGAAGTYGGESATVSSSVGAQYVVVLPHV